jgi:type III secretion protein V
MGALNSFFSKLSERQDLIFVVLFAVVVAMLIVPLPTMFIDLLLGINITISVLILMVAIYLKSVLELSTFPAIILVSTIFRLALTVSTTRLILAQGDAGQIISAFGNFVVGGNIVVGLVVFFIVAIVQFIVITKGAERIAEVSARFTLDALPGKQMAIDADVRAGDTTKEEAKERRRILEKESQFFGSMDGAMKFVKGDAIAGLIIVFVNLFGGIMIGVLQRGMPFGEATKLYTLLTVGDGLVAQIPSMLIAVAAGAVVTRVTTEESTDLGQDIGRQLAAEPKSLAIAAVIAAALGFVPGFPFFIFMVLAAFLGGVSFLLARKATRITDDNAQNESDALDAKAEEDAKKTLVVGGYSAVFSLSGSPELREELQRIPGFISALEDTFQDEGDRLGLPIRKLKYREYKGQQQLHFLVEGEAELIFSAAECRDVKTVTQKIIEVQKLHIVKIFDCEVASDWLANLKEPYPRIITDLDQSVKALFVVDVVRDLLEDGLTLSQPRPVLEALLRAKDIGPNPIAIADLARAGLKSGLTRGHVEADGKLPVVLLDVSMETHIRGLVANRGTGLQLAIRDARLAQSLDVLRNILSNAAAKNRSPMLIVQPDIRRSVRILLRAAKISAPVLGINEFDPNVILDNLGVLGSATADAPMRRTADLNVTAPAMV